jgi:hypothetical protein
MLSAILLVGVVALSHPEDVFGTAYIRAAACRVNMRTSPSTAARLRTTIATNTMVAVATKVTGGSWSAVCAGKTVSGHLWYRISSVNGKSVKSLYGTTYLYAADGLFKVPAVAAPTTTATPVYTASAPIVVRTNDVTIDGVTITSSGSTGAGISAIGSASAPIRNLTIRNCAIKGFNTGILARFVVNLVIENCTITDADYAGIGVYSGVGGRINGNTVRRIGYARTNLSMPGTLNNAYGITLDRDGAGFTSSSPYSSGFSVTWNLVEDVPLWHGLDTHAGQNITFSNNTVRRAARAVFITQDSAHDNPHNITFTGNHLESAITKSGGADTRGITIVGLVGGQITNNGISSTYGGAIIDGVNIEKFIALPDYPAPVGVTISGNAVIP